jgi:hypothetical protein
VALERVLEDSQEKAIGKDTDLSLQNLQHTGEANTMG